MPYKDPVTRREKQKQYSKTWYSRNRDIHIHKVWLRKDRERQKWVEYKAKQQCSHCGIQHPAVIDFHHVIKENKKSVNVLVKRYNNYNAAIREAEEKCIPLCANCHRIFHWNEHQHGTKRRRKKRFKKQHGNRWRHTRSTEGHTRVHERHDGHNGVQVPDTGGNTDSVFGRDTKVERGKREVKKCQHQPQKK